LSGNAQYTGDIYARKYRKSLIYRYLYFLAQPLPIGQCHVRKKYKYQKGASENTTHYSGSDHCIDNDDE